jgi:hypothetical protein
LKTAASSKSINLYLYIFIIKCSQLFNVDDLMTRHNTNEAKITECAANFLKFAPERIGGGGRGDN